MRTRRRRCPPDFHPNPKIARLFEQRLDRVKKGLPLDWAVGEMLAYASLVSAGVPIRLSGQDSRRGTFSHRHATLNDAKTGAALRAARAPGHRQRPLRGLGQPALRGGCLGFEYGYSLDYPDGLVVWEAQFGDFVNSAQVIIDQFIISGEDKWHRLSGLVLFLPHGYEGQGPEHSSARLERFLQQAAEDNIQVCNLTTPAQLFHALRRQVLRPWRKPLVIMTPKSHPASRHARPSTTSRTARSSASSATRRGVDPADVKRILLCSGKVYYDLEKKRTELGATDVAIVRLEQLYPLNDAIVKTLAPYKDGTPLVWVQDEPWNMGAWYQLNARLPALLDKRFPLSCVVARRKREPRHRFARQPRARADSCCSKRRSSARLRGWRGRDRQIANESPGILGAQSLGHENFGGFGDLAVEISFAAAQRQRLIAARLLSAGLLLHAAVVAEKDAGRART